MAHLELTPQDIPGVHAVIDWLERTIVDEGMDRPVFRVMAEYVASELKEAESMMVDLPVSNARKLRDISDRWYPR